MVFTKKAKPAKHGGHLNNFNFIAAVWHFDAYVFTAFRNSNQALSSKKTFNGVVGCCNVKACPPSFAKERGSHGKPDKLQYWLRGGAPFPVNGKDALIGTPSISFEPQPIISILSPDIIKRKYLNGRCIGCRDIITACKWCRMPP